MKIAIISDSHDNLSNIKKALNYLKKEKIRTILHCGDICSLETLEEILKNFSGKIFIVLGNVDNDHLKQNKKFFKKYPRLKIFREKGEIKIGKKRIAFVHFPLFARKLALTEKYDLIFYGHTHKPWQEILNKKRIVNPGNLAGLYFQATFAVYDTNFDKLKLILIAKI